MTEPRRLLEGGGTELERLLLASAEDDGPREESRRNAWLAVAGALAAGGAAAASPTPTHTSTGKAAAAKWGLAVAVVAGIGTAAVVWRMRRVETPGQDPRPTSITRTSEPPNARRAVVAPAPAPRAVRPASPQASRASAAPALATVPAARPRGSAAAPAPALGLTDEIAYLDAARNALAQNQRARAAALLDQYARTFPHGAMAEEATVLRIEALLQSGDRAAAEALGRRLLADDPRSPLSARVRALLGQEK